jgi:alpha-ketoglutaric semialdehyde dehydrogenase
MPYTGHGLQPVATVMVNLPSAGVEFQVPFGGTKASSLGPREQGPAAIDSYTQIKTVYMKY